LRLQRGRTKFGTFVDYGHYLWLHFVEQSICAKRGMAKMATVKLLSYNQPFLVRLGTTDLLCLTEVVLEDEYEDLLQLSSPVAHLVIDIGANVGYAIRLFSRHFPDATIIGIEPLPANMELCRRNAALAGTERVHLIECCIVGHPREVMLDESGGAWATRIAEPDGTRSAVVYQGRTLDEVLEDLKLATVPIDILKMDIEGAEREVIMAGGDWLGRVQRMAVEVHSPYTPQQFIADLTATGFQFEWKAIDEVVLAWRSDGCRRQQEA
jgi:FkbM family methyltransferase